MLIVLAAGFSTNVAGTELSVIWSAVGISVMPIFI